MTKEQTKKYNRKYRKENLKRLRELGREYYKKNRAAILVQKRKYTVKNKLRILAKKRGYYLKNKPLLIRKSLTYYRKNRERVRNENLKRLYSIDSKEYSRMLEQQKGCCAICKSPPGKKFLAVDHCHKTGRVRGLLCFRCNTGLGGLRDSQKILLEAIQYLKRTS